MTGINRSSNYYSNSIIGTPQVGADIDIYESSTSPKYAIGFGFTRADGNKYRYCQFGAATNRGLVVSRDVSETDFIYADNVRLVALVANEVTIAGETLAPNKIDSRYMQVTITASSNQFAGGYVSITSGTGIGFQYRIRGNTANGTPSTGDVYLELYDPIQVAVDSNTGFQIAGLAWSDIEVLDDGDDRLAAGVTVNNNSDQSYGWVQTYGVSTILSSLVLPTIGQQIFASSNTDGAIEGSVRLATSSNQTFARIGYCIQPASATYYGLNFLELE